MVDITYIKVNNEYFDKKRETKLKKMIGSGLKFCPGHKSTFGKHFNYDDETVTSSRLYKEQCPICGGYKNEIS
jgi:hypothetical protein